jgi:Ni/Co efflux regulator RcnB
LRLLVEHAASVRVLVAAACFLAVTATAAATAQPDPADLVLRRGDVPRGYALDRSESGPRTNAVEARENRELRSKFATWRRITGYQVEFERGDETIGSRVDLFRDRSGPRSMLAWFVKELRGSTQLMELRTKVELGDEALVYRWKLGNDQFSVVAWRYKAAFAVVGAGELGTTRTLALARVQQRRVAAALR